MRSNRNVYQKSAGKKEFTRNKFQVDKNTNM